MRQISSGKTTVRFWDMEVTGGFVGGPVSLVGVESDFNGAGDDLNHVDRYRVSLVRNYWSESDDQLWPKRSSTVIGECSVS